jgi:hypothetical protein
MKTQIKCKNCGSKDVRVKFSIIERKDTQKKVVVLNRRLTSNTKYSIEQDLIKIKLVCNQCKNSRTGIVITEEQDGLWINFTD